MFTSTSFSVATIGFVNNSYDVMEPGRLEVGVELVGNLSFAVNIVVEVVFSMAIGNMVE